MSALSSPLPVNRKNQKTFNPFSSPTAVRSEFQLGTSDRLLLLNIDVNGLIESAAHLLHDALVLGLLIDLLRMKRISVKNRLISVIDDSPIADHSILSQFLSGLVELQPAQADFRNCCDAVQRGKFTGIRCIRSSLLKNLAEEGFVAPIAHSALFGFYTQVRSTLTDRGFFVQSELIEKIGSILDQEKCLPPPGKRVPVPIFDERDIFLASTCCYLGTMFRLSDAFNYEFEARYTNARSLNFALFTQNYNWLEERYGFVNHAVFYWMHLMSSRDE